jgi:D-galactarolactone cycloisomerase
MYSSKIRAIDTWTLEAPLKQPFGFSQWYYRKKANALVRITTEEGAVGWGECYGPARPVADAIRHFYAERLLGRNPLQTETNWNHLYKSSLDFARKGIFMAALSGLDMAMWDLKGHCTGQPLWMMLGGKGDPIPCYATGMYFREGMDEDSLLSALLEEADGYVRAGFAMLKIKIGKNPAFDIRLIRAFRENFPTALLAADANHAYAFKEAVAIGKHLSECNFAWFEEPLAPDNLADMALLRRTLSVPIAGGECEQTRWGFQEVLRAGALDILQPDLAYCGGPSEFQKISAMASAQHVDVVPHCWGLRLNQAAAASAIGALPENPGRFESRPVFLEMDLTEHPIRDGIFKQWNEVRGGFLHLSNRPGLGVEVDEGALAQFHREVA